jgi:hypothetical protein
MNNKILRQCQKRLKRLISPNLVKKQKRTAFGKHRLSISLIFCQSKSVINSELQVKMPKFHLPISFYVEAKLGRKC